MEFDHDDYARGDLSEQLRPHIQGSVRIQPFSSPFDPGPAVLSVHFDAGGRTRPHVHHSGQVLYIIDGEGIVADGDGRHVVHAGDVVTARPDEWHWHGATADRAMSHFTVQMDIDWDVEERDWAEY
jgi:quercetin dioxygenase-like cupin family protein